MALERSRLPVAKCSRSHDLVIFDCDGVLVDSEPIGLTALAEMLRDEGFPIDDVTAINRFRGRKLADCLDEIQAQFQRVLPTGFDLRYRNLAAERFKFALKPVDGIVEVLPEIPLRTCVASSAPLEKIRLTLGITALLEHFDGRIFSAYELGVWKPDPGLFLHACQTMKSTPASTIVVEDSVVGAQAAMAAGMKVLGYAPAERAHELHRAGAIVFDDMRALPGLLRSIIEYEDVA
jgi:HAD superfamily hydrolase (TIGR01509 family)